MPRKKKNSNKKSAPPPDPVTQYARDVAAGKIVMGRWVRMACERHLKDLKRTDIKWDLKAALFAIGFFKDVLKLNGGQFEGQPFELLPFEIFIVGSLFGWKNTDGNRRYRVAYIEIGKGNGKSPLAAGIGHKLLIADGELRAEVYAAATKKDQAMILFRDAVAMRDQSPHLAARLQKSGVGEKCWNMADHKTSSWFRPISSDEDSQSGPRPHGFLVDEIHEHKSPVVIDMGEAGFKWRRQPLMVLITNSGYEKKTVCGQYHDYSIQVLKRVIPDDRHFAFVCGLDPCEKCYNAAKDQPTEDCPQCDDYHDEAIWQKANPALGYIIRPEEIRARVMKADQMPRLRNDVMRLNFCVWTQQKALWLGMDLWDGGAAPLVLATLAGRPCFAGLDLSSNRDLTAEGLVFPPMEAGERWKVLCRFWIPEENVLDRVRDDRVPYDQWIKEGWLETTPGNVVDKDWIEKAVLDDAAKYRILRVCYDRMFADQMVQHLEQSRPGYVPDVVINPLSGKQEKQWCIPIGMGFGLAAGSKEFERLVQGQQVQHGGNPVLRWNAANATVKQDEHGNFWPIKTDDKKRIDGIVAVVMALARAIVEPKTIEEASVYEKRGILTI